MPPTEQISLTDPDARAMATSARLSGLVGYNVQSAVDTETHLIVAHEVTNQGFDRAQLSPMAAAAKAVLGRETLHAIADKGYFSGAEVLACDKVGITVTVPRPETSGNRGKGMFVKADFLYDPERDVYRCPAGSDLTYRYTREEGGLQVGRYWTNECQNCPVRHRCTSGKERRITRWEHEHLIDEMRGRLGRDPDLMTLRRCTVEHPFGTIKAWMGTTHFPDTATEERRHGNGAERSGLQHQADDLADRHSGADGGNPKLTEAACLIAFPGKTQDHSCPPKPSKTAHGQEFPHSLGLDQSC